MKKIITIMLLICLLCSCKQNNVNTENIDSPYVTSENESQEIQSSINTVDLTESNNSEMPVISIDKKDADDIEILSEEEIKLYDNIIYEHIGKQERNKNYIEMIDNNSSLSELLSLNPKKIQEEYLWYVSNARVNAFQSECTGNNWSSRCPLSSLEESIGFDIQFVRSNGIYHNKEMDKEFYALYTVFETEIGGYLYCWFDYYPSTSETFWKEAIYVDKTLCYEDFKTLRDGDSIDIVSQITKSVLGLKKNHIQTYTCASQILLSDGILVINYNPDTWTIRSIHYTDNFTSRSIFSNKYNNDCEWLDRNLTILPQDYPPAS